MIGSCCSEVGCFEPVMAITAQGTDAYCDFHNGQHRADDADMWLAAAAKRHGELAEARETAAFASRVSRVKKGQWT